jgi:hypothetical protein
LCKFASWQLKRKNAQNNISEDVEDFIQDLRISLIRAGVYYKRQTYIEDSLSVSKKYVTDEFAKKILEELEDLWNNRKKHGANKQKFGPHQEKLLEKILRNFVPKKDRPNPKSPLRVDTKFITYCKNIAWNQQKSMGRKITKERSVRNGNVSLSDYDYFAKEI